MLTNKQKVVYNARKSTSCRPKESFMPQKRNKQTKTTTATIPPTEKKTGFCWTVKCFLSKKAIIFFLNGASYLEAATSGILKKKKCSENIQQIYRRTPTPKYVFNQRTPLGGCF